MLQYGCLYDVKATITPVIDSSVVEVLDDRVIKYVYRGEANVP